MKHLVVQWPRFGPYHLARLRELNSRAIESGVRLTGLEIAADDEAYAWKEETAAEAFDRVQLFSDGAHESLRPSDVRQKVHEALDRLSPDAVAICSYSFPDARACLEWCRQNRRIAIIMTDTKADYLPRTRLREAIKGVLVRGFDGALVAGQPHRDYLLEFGFPPQLIRPGVDVVDNAFFREGAAEVRADPDRWRHLPGLDDRTPYFLASNRFDRRKNLPLFLDAYRAYRSSVSNPWRLILLGDGPLRPMLEQKIQTDAIEGVVLAGFRDKADLPAYYGLAGAFVHPTSADQWGLVVNEAMASSLPVIVSTSAGCYQDLVEPGINGFLFDAPDAAALTRALGEMSHGSADPVEMGRRSAEIISNWGPGLFADSMLALMKEAEPRANRAFPFLLRAILSAMNVALRKPTSFHAYEP